MNTEKNVKHVDVSLACSEKNRCKIFIRENQRLSNISTNITKKHSIMFSKKAHSIVVIYMLKRFTIIQLGTGFETNGGRVVSYVLLQFIQESIRIKSRLFIVDPQYITFQKNVVLSLPKILHNTSSPT